MLLLAACFTGAVRGKTVQAASKSSAKYTLKRTSFKKKYTMYLGKTKTVKVSYKSGSKISKKIIWKSSNPSVVQVKASKTGKTCKLKALKTGKAKITCYPKGKKGKKLTCTITVKKKVPKIKSLSFADKTIEVYVGDKVQSKLTVKPAGAKKSKVSYTSSKKTVAKVSSKGVVTGLKAGTTKITVKSTDGSNKKATYKVKVRMISFANATANIYIGDTYQNKLKNQVTRAGSSGIKWSSSNPAVATVDGTGTVKGVGKGTALITAKINNKTEAAASFMVDVSYRLLNSSTKFIAHRGLSSEAPENTLLAFDKAGQAGFWGIETDIRKTNDGKFILLHDATFSRMCGVNKKPEDMTLDEIRELNIITGNNYDLYKNDQRATKIPTLEEYLNVCLQYNMVPVIEIKMSYDHDAPADPDDEGQASSGQTVSGQTGDGQTSGASTSDGQSSGGQIVDGQYLQDMETEDMREVFRITNSIMGSKPYMFIDYDYKTLLVMQKVLPIENRPNITMQYISRTYDAETRTICEANGLEYDLKYSGVTQTGINQIRKNGGKVNLWTVDDKDKAEDYIINGIDYITTNKKLW